WCPPPPPHGLPGEQRLDEVHALVFTTAPLEDELVCLGFPRMRVPVSHPGPTALLSVKLADVAPDGCSQLVTRGVLNLSHRDGHADPRPLSPRTWTPVEIELNPTAWRFTAGHRIRLALAGSDWPTVWPAATVDPVRVRVGGEEAVLELPIAPTGEAVEVSPAPPQPVEPTVNARPASVTWRAVRDGITRSAGIESSIDVFQEVADTGTTIRETRSFDATASESDQLDVVVQGVTTFHLRRPDVDAQTRATGRFTCTAEEFRAEISLEVEADGSLFVQHAWDERVPRDLV
ncbi:MAG: hypothetical protein M3377_04615, partial [Actinomycetota bacterium]|nr:hypothetical protein [Actinomycetota bacterium]